MRGKEGPDLGAAIDTRITPAHAGKSTSKLWFEPAGQDHPRACGEKTTYLYVVFFILGSPPRMRGKAGYWVKDEQGRGITPAHAGKRCWRGFSPYLGGDHPRACGEKTGAPWRWLMVTGSPPRMRGKGIKQSNCRVGMRITPAHAGKRLHKPLRIISIWDHPRACGEKR